MEDSADPNALNWTVTGGALTNDYYLGTPATISYGQGVSSLEVRGGSGANTFLVQSVGPTTTIDAGSGTSAVTVGDAAHNLLFVGALTVKGNGRTTLTVDDRGNGPAPTGFPGYTPLLTQYLAQYGALTRTALALVTLPQVGPTELAFNSAIKYQRLGALTIDGGPSGSYAYQIDSTGGTRGLTVNAESSGDAVTAGDAQNNLLNVVALNVNGNGHTTLTVDDRGNVAGLIGAANYTPQNTSYLIDDGRLTRTAYADVFPSPLPQSQAFRSTIQYQGLAGLTIDGGPTGPYAYQINGTIGAASVVVNAGGQDAVTLGDKGHNLNDVANVQVNGNGATTVEMDDRGDRQLSTASSFYLPIETQFFVEAGRLQDPPSGVLTRLTTALTTIPTGQLSYFPFTSTVGYNGLASVTIDGGPLAANLYQIDNTAGAADVAVNAGGTDAVSVGEPQGTLDAIANVTVTGNGRTTLTLNDQGASGREEYDVHSTMITREPITTPATSPTQTVAYSGLTSIVVNGANSSLQPVQRLRHAVRDVGFPQRRQRRRQPVHRRGRVQPVGRPAGDGQPPGAGGLPRPSNHRLRRAPRLLQRRRPHIHAVRQRGRQHGAARPRGRPHLRRPQPNDRGRPCGGRQPGERRERGPWRLHEHHPGQRRPGRRRQRGPRIGRHDGEHPGYGGLRGRPGGDFHPDPG